MSNRRKILGVLVIVGVGGIAFIYGQLDVARKSIKFDLRKIGESVYEAHLKTGKWPARIEDLDGTEYLSMPHRRNILEQGAFIVVWHQELNADPKANRDRILAYDNGSLFSRVGWVWACRGDLSIERIDAESVRRLNLRSK